MAVVQGPPASNKGDRLILELTDVQKRYGLTQALSGASMQVDSGEIVGVIGHNGAGKSTLMRAIVGLTRPDHGSVTLQGHEVGVGYSMQQGRALGVRIAFQELSLAPTLRVFENVLLTAPTTGGWGWRKRCSTLIRDALDEVFPGHGISVRQSVSALSLAQRQMLEISAAIVETNEPFRLLILDEPTSALPMNQADSLFAHLKRLKATGISTILISHKLHDILGHTDRTIVMRDGRVISEQQTRTLDYDQLVTIMGGVAKKTDQAELTRAEVTSESPVVLEASRIIDGTLDNASVVLRAGEIVGLSGLDGQGQQRLLRYLWRNRHGSRNVQVTGGMSFVTGDRQGAGVFSLWSVGQNIGVGVFGETSRAGVVRLARERALVADWMKRLAVRGLMDTPIVDLSGGNQQKALIARALAAQSRVVLLDDPFRGVDLETKQQVYRLMRDETAKGRSFLWFTTENSELSECDRVYVMAAGAISSELVSDEITEEAVIGASFERA